MAQEGAPLKKIRTTVLKKDGKIGSLRAIDAIIGHTRKDPSWEGGNSSAGSRPQEMTPAELRRLQKLCGAGRGGGVDARSAFAVSW